jgi:hypothetical protein
VFFLGFHAYALLKAHTQTPPPALPHPPIAYPNGLGIFDWNHNGKKKKEDEEEEEFILFLGLRIFH